MTIIITDRDLASYPGVESTCDRQTLRSVVTLVNGLISDVIGDLDPIPTKVKTIALEAAARALRYSQGASSVSVAIDDWKKTVRYEGPDGAFRSGVYLTDDELAELRGMLGDNGVGAIKLRLPWAQSADLTY